MLNCLFSIYYLHNNAHWRNVILEWLSNLLAFVAPNNRWKIWKSWGSIFYCWFTYFWLLNFWTTCLHTLTAWSIAPILCFFLLKIITSSFHFLIFSNFSFFVFAIVINSCLLDLFSSLYAKTFWLISIYFNPSNPSL